MERKRSSGFHLILKLALLFFLAPSGLISLPNLTQHEQFADVIKCGNGYIPFLFWGVPAKFIHCKLSIKI